MDSIVSKLKPIIESIIHKPVTSIEKLPNVVNNTVYNVIADNPYIFKLYKSADWPENGKLPFIHRVLEEHHINCAKLLVFERHDGKFPNGYLLEEYIEGVSAESIKLEDEEGIAFYKQLAELISQVHQIHLENFGYIGTGVASHSSFMTFMMEKFEEIATELITSNCLERELITRIKPKVFAQLKKCSHLPSVLNHGDLSTKNIIIQSEQLILIDWDDAMAYNWIADIARLTYWMKFTYTEHEYTLYRKSFLELYGKVNDVNLFIEVENAFHVWIGMDHLNYFQHTPHYEPTLHYLLESINRL